MNIFFENAWVVWALFFMFACVLAQALWKESHKRNLLRASAVPILMIVSAPIIWMLIPSTPQVVSLTKVMVTVSYMTTVIVVGIFMSLDAGRALPLSEAELQDIKKVRLPRRLGGDRTVVIGRRASVSVRSVRNTGAALGLITVLLMQVNFMKVMTISDYFVSRVISPDSVWSMMNAENIRFDGDMVKVVTTKGVAATFHCDDYSVKLSDETDLRFSSGSIRYVANLVCSVPQTPVKNRDPGAF